MANEHASASASGGEKPAVKVAPLPMDPLVQAQASLLQSILGTIHRLKYDVDQLRLEILPGDHAELKSFLMNEFASLGARFYEGGHE